MNFSYRILLSLTLISSAAQPVVAGTYTDYAKKAGRVAFHAAQLFAAIRIVKNYIPIGRTAFKEYCKDIAASELGSNLDNDGDISPRFSPKGDLWRDAVMAIHGKSVRALPVQSLAALTLGYCGTRGLYNEFKPQIDIVREYVKQKFQKQTA